MKLIQHNRNQDLQKQVIDAFKNLENIVKEIDGMLNRIKQLEADQLDGEIRLISK